MCGLLGLHTIKKFGLFKTEVDEFKMMLHMTAFRGRDSTGIAGVDLDSEVDVAIVKAVEAPHYLFNFEETDTFFTRAVASYTTMIGHCRYATRGALNAQNAHPYKEGDIILAHNGVISNFDALKDKEKHKHIDVDSHLITALMNENSPIEVIERVEGAYVFMWFNQKDRTFNIARNYQRPLYVGNNLDTTLLFASEEETLKWNAKRNKTPLKTIEMLQVNKIFSWTAGSLEPTIQEFKPYTKVYPAYPSANNRNHSDSYYDSYRIPPKNFNVIPINKPVKDIVIGESPIPELKINQEITFTILDEIPNKTTTTIIGAKEEYPNITFKAFFNYKVEDTILIESGFLRGTIRQIAKQDSRNGGEDKYTVYVKPEEFLDEEEQDYNIDTLPFKNMNGENFNLSRALVEQLLDLPCAWCGIKHGTQGTVIEDVLYDEREDALICSFCSETPLQDLALKESGAFH